MPIAFTSDLFALATDERFLFGAGAVLLSGLVRGFSGFGSALIHMPLVSVAYGPVVAATTFMLLELVAGAAFSLRAAPLAQWRQISPLMLAALPTIPLGALALTLIDPVHLRWFISAIVLAAVLGLASGWRYKGEPRLPVTLAVGGISGLLGGAVQIAGPPVILYWLGGSSEAKTLRANFLTFFTLLSTAVGIVYAFKGLLTREVILLAVLFGPAHFAAMLVGAHLFGFASEMTYRRIAYATISLAALISVPWLDGWLR